MTARGRWRSPVRCDFDPSSAIGPQSHSRSEALRLFIPSSLDRPLTQAWTLGQDEGLDGRRRTTCGVITGDRPYCWEWNFYASSGDGTTTNRSTPVAVAVLCDLNRDTESQDRAI